MGYQPTAYYLIVRKGPNPGTVHTLRGNVVTIGRQPDNHITVNDHRVSRHHAQLSWRGATYLLEDLGSGNGTWVNNARVTGPVTLRPGDIIGLSQEVLMLYSDRPDTGDVTYHVPAGAVAPAAAPVPPHAMAARPPAAPVPLPPPTRRSQGWTAFGIGGLIALVAVLLMAVAVLMVFVLARPSAPAGTPTTETASVVAAATPTTFLTPTPYPTYTPYPTPTSTSTPMPTSTPGPTATPVPTATPFPTYTPYPTQMPTSTPYPTYTPYPTPTSALPPPPTSPPPQPPPPRPRETDTPVPTPTHTPVPYVVTLGYNIVYEPWGNPGNPDGCNGPYDDRIEVRRFTVEVIVTNNSRNFIPDRWSPTFLAASGAALPTCIWYYNNTVVEPGETADVTFATHLKKGDYVRAMVFDFPGAVITLCLDGSGRQIPCP